MFSFDCDVEPRNRREGGTPAAAKAKVPGGTIIRVETDADGNSAYEAHMVRADGTPVTVYVNKQFDVVSIESGLPGRPGRNPQSSSAASA